MGEQAGAELCQAQYKLELVNFLFGSVASLKFDCLVQTGTITAKIFNTSGEAAIVNNQMLQGQMLHGQMLNRKMLHGQMGKRRN